LGCCDSSRSRRQDRRCVGGGLFGSRAAFHDEFGCVCCTDPKEPYLLKSDVAALKTPKTPPLLPEIAGPRRRAIRSRLKAALDHAFEEPAAAVPQNQGGGRGA
jgi:hypothetical protein